MRLKFAALLLTTLLACLWGTSLALGAPATPLEGFVEVDGVRLQYLDWGGGGPALILLHGLGDNPHAFDDLAPAFSDRFHVLAYARRGSGSSDAKGPYDVKTLTEDLKGFMEALKIPRANLVGHSAGGDEITRMASEYPERVISIVYLDSGYDWADPGYRTVYEALPFKYFARPASAMASLDAFRAYQRATWYPSLDDMSRLEANLRQSVVLQADGSVRDRTPNTVIDALYAALWINPRRDYTRVRCPALAIYPRALYDLKGADPTRRRVALDYEHQYWDPFRARSMERVRQELAHAEIAQVDGAHVSFFLTDRQRVVNLMRRFLSHAGEANGP